MNYLYRWLLKRREINDERARVLAAVSWETVNITADFLDFVRFSFARAPMQMKIVNYTVPFRREASVIRVK